MIDINSTYRRLSKHLNKTRKTLTQVCRELEIDISEVEDYYLQKEIDQCSHCDLWSKELKDDLDGNPICPVCYDLIGA